MDTNRLNLLMKRPTVFTFLLSLPLFCNAASFSVEQDEEAVTIQLDGELFTRYVLGGEGNKPYFWPLLGPGGVPMTRNYPMKNVEGEKQDHPHHRSMYFGHQNMNGFNTWHEKLTIEEQARGNAAKLAKGMKTLGKTETLKIRKAAVEGDHAVLETESVYLDASGRPILEDERLFIFRVDPETGSRMVDVSITFVGTQPTIKLGDIKDAGFSIRVAHSMTVDAGNSGQIINSEGHQGKKAWGKRAAWCDFHGPVEGKTVGIAVLNHPSSFRFPTPWHVRTYGLLTANPFGLRSVAREGGSGDVVLKRGDRICLNYRVILHEGNEVDAKIKDAFKRYSEEKPGEKF